MTFDIWDDNGDKIFDSYTIGLNDIYFTSNDDQGGHDETPNPGYLPISGTGISIGNQLSNAQLVTDLSDVKLRINGLNTSNSREEDNISFTTALSFTDISYNIILMKDYGLVWTLTK